MTMTNAAGYDQDYLLWFAANFLLEGLDAIKMQRELTEQEESLFDVLEGLSSHYCDIIFPPDGQVTSLVPARQPVSDLWARAAAIEQSDLDPLELIGHRDEARPRGGCRFCGHADPGAV